MVAKTRLTPPPRPLSEANVQDRIFPEEAKLSFNNYIVGILDAKTDVQFNFIFANGDRSQIRAERAMVELMFADLALKIHKIVLWYNDADTMLFGIQLFTKEGIKVLETGYQFQSKPH